MIAPMPDKQIRVAVLGQGRSGHDIHIKWLKGDAERYKIVAVADQLPERHATAIELGAKVFADYRDLLKDRDLKLDFVVNALPSHLHPQGTIEILDAGYHVMCEKPAAITVADFDRMVAASKKASRKLLIFQNSRFNPGFVKLREILASGKLGKLVHARISYSGFARRWDWQASQNYQGGNLNNTGPHPLDMAVVLFGDRTPEVFTKLVSENPFGDAENFAAVTLHGKDAPTIEVVVSSVMAYPQGDQFNLSCTLGGLAGNTSSLKWKYFDPKSAPPHEARPTQWSENRTYNSEKLDWVEESWTDETGIDLFTQLSKRIYDNVHEVLTNGAEPIIQLAQVRRQVAILEEAHRQNPLPKRS